LLLLSSLLPLSGEGRRDGGMGEKCVNEAPVRRGSWWTEGGTKVDEEEEEEAEVEAATASSTTSGRTGSSMALWGMRAVASARGGGCDCGASEVVACVGESGRDGDRVEVGRRCVATATRWLGGGEERMGG